MEFKIIKLKFFWAAEVQDDVQEYLCFLDEEEQEKNFSETTRSLIKIVWQFCHVAQRNHIAERHLPLKNYINLTLEYL